MEIKINAAKLNAFLSSDKNTDYMKNIVTDLIQIHLGLTGGTMHPNQKKKGYQLLADLNVAEIVAADEDETANQLNS